MANKRPEKTGRSFEKNIEAQLLNLGYKKVKSSKFLELSKHSNEKMFASQFNLGKNIYKTKQIVDFIITRADDTPLVIQAKWQQSKGSVDEKFPFLVINLKEESPFDSLIVIDGGGYRSDAVTWMKEQIDNKLLGVFSFSEFMIWSNNEL
jgi:hypothetical protein